MVAVEFLHRQNQANLLDFREMISASSPILHGRQLSCSSDSLSTVSKSSVPLQNEMVCMVSLTSVFTAKAVTGLIFLVLTRNCCSWVLLVAGLKGLQNVATVILRSVSLSMVATSREERSVLVSCGRAAIIS